LADVVGMKNRMTTQNRNEVQRLFEDKPIHVKVRRQVTSGILFYKETFPTNSVHMSQDTSSNSGSYEWTFKL